MLTLEGARDVIDAAFKAAFKDPKATTFDAVVPPNITPQLFHIGVDPRSIDLPQAEFIERYGATAGRELAYAVQAHGLTKCAPIEAVDRPMAKHKTSSPLGGDITHVRPREIVVYAKAWS